METSEIGPFARSWSPMTAAYRQVKSEALAYAKTVDPDPTCIRGRASIIAKQTFAILSKRIKESETYDEVLATVFLSNAKGELLSLIGTFQQDLTAILRENVKLKEQPQASVPDQSFIPISPHDHL